jgi:hypothetical protein
VTDSTSKAVAIIHRKAVLMVREAMEARYRIERLREDEQIRDEGLLDEIAPEDVRRIQLFFQHTLYPDVKEREQRDESFERLASILRNPANLISMIPALPRIMLKFGGNFGKALRTGLDVVAAYRLATRLERQLVESLARRFDQEGVQVDEDTEISPDLFRDAYSDAPYADGRRMVELLRSIVDAAKDEELVKEARDILREVQRSLHDPAEVEAVRYIDGVLDEVERISVDFSDPQMDRMVRIAEIVEVRFMDEMYGRR